MPDSHTNHKDGEADRTQSRFNEPGEDVKFEVSSELISAHIEEDDFEQKRQPGVLLKILRTSFLILLIAAILTTGGIYVWLNNLGVFNVEYQLKAALQTQTQRDNSIVFDRNGGKIGEFFTKYHLYIPFNEIPKPMIQAILAVEDRNFFQHEGIDILAILRAAKSSFSEGEYSQGASTITQQVVRNLFLSREKTLNRKVKEIAIALQLERMISKQEILEIYVNKMFLGFGSYGIGAAAKRFFNKTVKELDLHECALIAGMFQSPSSYNPHRYPARALKRQRQVLSAMFEAGYLSREDAVLHAKKPLNYASYKPLNEQIAPFFIDFVKEEAHRILGKNVEGLGFRIYTTLDSQLQLSANQTFNQSDDIFNTANSMIIPDFRKHERGKTPSVEAALLTIEPTTGEILTMIGGRDYDESKYNRTWQSMRQPGSVFKPIVYSLALSSGFKWNDMLFVSPVSIGGYRPKNFGNNYLSETTVLRAFYLSLNTATVEIGTKIGLQRVIEYARELGVKSPLKEEPGTLIGSSELTMMDLARAYAVFANYGKRNEPFAIREIRDARGKVIYKADPLKEQKQVISPQISYLITQGLKEVIRRGTASKANHLAGIAAGKTGTSNDSIDNWFAGFTSNLLTIVWIGVDKQLSMGGKATGGNLALPLWERFMTAAVDSREKVPFLRPKGVISERIDPKFGHPSAEGISMWFLSNNRPPKGVSATAEFKTLEEKTTFRSLFLH